MSHYPTPRLLLLAMFTLCACASAQDGPAHGDAAWPVVGRQSIVRMVIVPLAQARERSAYAAQIDRLCEPQQSCFINFYSNSQGVTPTLPLPDAIEHEPTAIYRRSMKQAGEFFRWSCRLEIEPEACF